MKFEQELFNEYKNLIENTKIQECYQHIINYIKHISSQLEKEMINYNFMNRIVENSMNFTYFQITNKNLKENGLKIQVVFIHKTCMFEVWLSGYNRKIQNDYYRTISNTKCPFEVCVDPNKNDYIVKIPINLDICIDDLEEFIFEIKHSINKLEEFIKLSK